MGCRVGEDTFYHALKKPEISIFLGRSILNLMGAARWSEDPSRIYIR